MSEMKMARLPSGHSASAWDTFLEWMCPAPGTSLSVHWPMDRPAQEVKAEQGKIVYIFANLPTDKWTVRLMGHSIYITRIS